MMVTLEQIWCIAHRYNTVVSRATVKALKERGFDGSKLPDPKRYEGIRWCFSNRDEPGTHRHRRKNERG